jgi:Flp pilus assembly protein TadD
MDTPRPDRTLLRGNIMTIRESIHRHTRPTTALLGACVCLLLITAGCTTAVNLRDEGVLALNRGQNELALTKLTQAVQKDPSGARTHYQLGRAYLATDQNLEAQYELEKAYALRPNDPELTPGILDSLAESLFRQQRMENLFAFLDKQVAQDGSTRDFLRQGEYLAKAGDPDAARLAFRKAAYFADQNDAEPYIAIADFYTSIGDQPNAVTALRYANYVDAGNLEVADRLRQFGIVPGPTVTEAPPKPALLR